MQNMNIWQVTILSGTIGSWGLWDEWISWLSDHQSLNCHGTFQNLLQHQKTNRLFYMYRYVFFFLVAGLLRVPNIWVPDKRGFTVLRRTIGDLMVLSRDPGIVASRRRRADRREVSHFRIRRNRPVSWGIDVHWHLRTWQMMMMIRHLLELDDTVICLTSWTFLFIN